MQRRPLISTSEQMAALSKLAFPLILAESSSLVMALIDLVMIGRLGTKALAALGLSVFSNRLIVASVEGLTSSVRGIVARRRGECSTETECLPLNAGLLIALVVGAPLAVISCLVTPLIFPLISSDPDVTRIGIPFLSILFLTIPAIGMHNAFSGYWTGVEKPRLYMLIILFMNCLNILLNYALIFGHFGIPALGATGAAISTATSLYVGVLINGLILHFRFPKDGFLKAKPERALVMRMFELTLPINITQFFFVSCYLVFLWFIGQVGTAELAAASVIVRITMILAIVAVSIGIASATVVSRTVGEGDLAGAVQWGWSAGKLGIIAATLMGFPMLLFPKMFLSIFVSDPYTMSIAETPLRLQGAMIGIFSLIYIFGSTLGSLGDGKRVMIIFLATEWLLFLPVVWFVGPHLHYGLLQLWLVNLANSLLLTVLITGLWIDGRWKTIKI